MDTTFLINFLSCLLMTGIIWLVQLTHYPSFKYVEQNSWREFHRFHTTSITKVVAPLMLLQLLSSFALLFNNAIPPIISIINFTCISLIFITTTFISVPLHGKLTFNYEKYHHDLLVKTNWIRTFLWTFATFILTLHIYLEKNV